MLGNAVNGLRTIGGRVRTNCPARRVFAASGCPAYVGDINRENSGWDARKLLMKNDYTIVTSDGDFRTI
jgi:hypothetical protein